jgi:excinuclease ABC subunit A
MPNPPPARTTPLKGWSRLDKVINITQDPIGRNPRSNPGTYVGVLGEIRQVFASMPDAKAAGYKPGASASTSQGRALRSLRRLRV